MTTRAKFTFDPMALLRLGAGVPGLNVKDALANLMFIRLAVLFFALSLAIVSNLFQRDVVSSFLVCLGFGLLSAAFLFSLVYALLFERLPGTWWMVLGQVFFDTVLTSVWVHFSGGHDSVYALLYLIQILAVAVIFHQRVALAAAALASVGYGVVVSVTGVHTPLMSWAIYSSAFVILGLVGGFLTQELHAASESLKEKQRTIEKLRAFQERIVADIPTGLLTVDEEMVINFINPAGAQILGRDPGTVVGRALAEVETGMLPFFTNIPVETVADESEEIAEASPGMKTELSATGDQAHRSFFVSAKSQSGRARLQQTVEIGEGDVRRTIRGDVAELDADAALGQLLGDKAKRGRVLLFQDVTKLRHLEEKVRQHEKLAAVGQLAAGIAHEIRNPLASMSASIELLKTSIPAESLGAEEAKLMDIAIREIDRLNQLISEFLDFVRPVKLRFEPVNLKELLTDLVLAAKKRKDLDPTVHVRENYDNDVIAKANQEKLKQVVWNLLVNAFQAMNKSGKIEVGCCRVSEQRVKFWVEDEGTGMSEEILRRLYEPFFTTKDRGTGLGLATVYKIVEAHHGDIRVHSTEKIGTKFEVILQAA